MPRKAMCGAVVLAAVLAAACGDGSSTPVEPRPGHANLTLSLGTSVVAPGQRVPVALTLLNDGDEPLSLAFRSSCQVDLVVESSGTTIWSLMSRALCADVITEVTLQPRQAVVYDLVWDQSRDDGKPPQPGTYTLRGVLLTSERPQSSPATLLVR